MKEDNLKDRAMREFSQLNKEIEVVLSALKAVDDKWGPREEGQRSLPKYDKEHLGTHHTTE